MKRVLTKKAKQKTPTTPDESIFWIHLFFYSKNSVFAGVKFSFRKFLSILVEGSIKK
jgi:hypothetical protein